MGEVEDAHLVRGEERRLFALRCRSSHPAPSPTELPGENRERKKGEERQRVKASRRLTHG